MEAKDVKWCPQHGYPLPCNKCGMPLSQTQQKEIYKAGMKEVVGLISKDTNNFELPISLGCIAKLKEWRIA